MPTFTDLVEQEELVKVEFVSLFTPDNSKASSRESKEWPRSK